MAFRIERMTIEDVPEVMAIERDSFLTPWPLSAYKRELNENRNAHYLVMRMDSGDQFVPELTTTAPVGAVVPERRSFWSQFFFPNRGRNHAPPSSQQSLAGYAGLWLMVDEAHITTIAIRPHIRGRGLGELLLVALTDIALEINARWLTLEVRVSNNVAQALYRKYGFKPAGIRQRYYSDNQEDALIMWTDEIQAPEFRERFRVLKAGLLHRLISAGDLEPDSLPRAARRG